MASMQKHKNKYYNSKNKNNLLMDFLQNKSTKNLFGEIKN